MYMLRSNTTTAIANSIHNGASIQFKNPQLFVAAITANPASDVVLNRRTTTVLTRRSPMFCRNSRMRRLGRRGWKCSATISVVTDTQNTTPLIHGSSWSGSLTIAAPTAAWTSGWDAKLRSSCQLK